jgi:hypothetical protein
MYEDAVALSYLLPLDRGHPVSDEMGVQGTLCLHHCQRILEISKRYWEAWPSDDYSLFNIVPLHHAAVALLHRLSDVSSHDLMERTCVELSRYIHDFPLALWILHAVKEIASNLRMELPDGLSKLLQTTRLPASYLVDVPAAFVMLVPEKLIGLTREHGDGAPCVKVEVGEMISQGRNLEYSCTLDPRLVALGAEGTSTHSLSE